MRKYILSLLFLLILNIGTGMAQVQEEQISISNRENAKEHFNKPYVILISIDGFRHDYFEQYKPEFLNAMEKQSVKAEYMIPSYPSVTFPNHYTIVTGMIPPHHGLVGNSMLDPKTGERYSLRNTKAVRDSKWYAGVPIWSLAESQDMISACFYWPGSEAEIAGYYPTYYFNYAENKGVEERIEQVVSWLELPEAKRPHIITFYMPEVDQAGHKYGPNAYETEAMVHYIDGAMKKLYESVEKTGLDVNYIFVSDHGMTDVKIDEPLRLPKIDAEKWQVSVNGTYASIFVNDKKEIKEAYAYFKENATSEYSVYLKTEVPKKYRLSDKEDKLGRIGDVVLIAEAPYYFSNNVPPKGAHGYHPSDTPDMNTVFMAWGPQIKKSKKIKAFQNIHVYPLLAELLELDYSHEIDGDKRLIKKVLK